MLNELEKQHRADARARFIAAVWDGVNPARLLPLASTAGMTSEEADRVVRRIRQGREQAEQARQLPSLRRDAAGTKARFNKIRARADAEIARLESEADAAALEADQAWRAVCAAEECSRQLLQMLDEGLFSPEKAPAEVFALIRRRDAEERSRQAGSARRDAEDERNRRRQAVMDLESRLLRVPATLAGGPEQSPLKGQLKEAKRQLADAEGRLRKAEAEAEAAHKEVR